MKLAKPKVPKKIHLLKRERLKASNTYSCWCGVWFRTGVRTTEDSSRVTCLQCQRKAAEAVKARLVK